MICYFLFFILFLDAALNGDGINGNNNNGNAIKSSTSFLNGQNVKFSMSSSSALSVGGRERDREKEREKNNSNTNNNNSNNILLDLSTIGVDGLKKSKRTYGDGKYFRFFFLQLFTIFHLELLNFFFIFICISMIIIFSADE